MRMREMFRRAKMLPDEFVTPPVWLEANMARTSRIPSRQRINVANFSKVLLFRRGKAMHICF